MRKKTAPPPSAAVQTTSAEGPPRRLAALVVLGAVAVGVAALDLLSKLVAVDRLADRAPVRLLGGAAHLTLTRNSGAAFGLGAGATVVFTTVALTVVVVIARTASRLSSTAWAVTLGLLLGGALGNLADRMFRAPGPVRGHVVDWIELPHWPVFNVADSAIVVGGLCAVLLSARGVGLDGRRTSDATSPDAKPPDAGV